MIIGDLVSHSPTGSPIEVILRKLDGCKDEDITPDFSLGVIVDERNSRYRVFSHQLPHLSWYDKQELKVVV
tara:strand:+ start:82 stop:294 length:213 start_codon:yes stop_codon:yes gene_type:complete